MKLAINGKQWDVKSSPLTRLLDVLRGEFGLTGTKEGCGEGECGTCTVLLDGEAVNACLIPVGQCAGREIITVEGLVDGKKMSTLARAFIDRGGVQCGICTPGMILSAHSLLQKNPIPTEFEIREALAGNICRCTGYSGIVQAVVKASGRMNGGEG